MLADDIRAACGSVDDRLMGGAFTKLAELVNDAQRFSFDADVMRSAQTIMLSNVDSQLRALKLCRLPFADTWFEWPAGFTGEPSTRGILAPVPKRMGALVNCIDDSLQVGTITWAWFHQSMKLNTCPITLTFDWREEPEPLPDLTDAARWHLRATDADWDRMRQKYPRVGSSSRESIIDDNRRFGVIINPLCKQLLQMASVAGDHVWDLLMKAAIKDIEGEGPLLRAAIMLLNSRNLAERVPRPVPPKLNRARTKSGKAPLLDHTQVRIRLSRALGQRAGMAADPREPSRLHLVRGHFKIRATGVFWWSPHARGRDAGQPIHQQGRHVTV